MWSRCFVSPTILYLLLQSKTVITVHPSLWLLCSPLVSRSRQTLQTILLERTQCQQHHHQSPRGNRVGSPLGSVPGSPLGIGPSVGLPVGLPDRLVMWNTRHGLTGWWRKYGFQRWALPGSREGNCFSPPTGVWPVFFILPHGNLESLWKKKEFVGIWLFLSRKSKDEVVDCSGHGAPIVAHTHTHPSHTQTSRRLSTSLSLGIPFLHSN